MRPRVIVVGAGIAGCVLAIRLADRFDVLLLEAGPADPESGTTAGVQPATTHTPTWALPAQLVAGRRWKATPGRAVGGSSVVNGGYFAAPVRADLDAWHHAGGEAWKPELVLERIDEYAGRLGVHASPRTHPIVRAFADACARADHADGLLPLHTTFADGSPRNLAGLLVDAPKTVRVRSDCRALRIVVDGGRAVGVEVADADGSSEILTADEIVVAAGGFGTPRLLLASGIGPAEDLQRVGIDPVVDLAGVGAAFSDHPTVWVEWMPTLEYARTGPHPEDASGPFPIALTIAADGGPGDDVEILACTQPPDPEAINAPDAAPLGLVVGLQRPLSRGTVRAASARLLAAPAIDYGYLAEPRDRAALRTGVRLAASLLTSPAFAPLVDRLVDLDAQTLRSDEALDAWIEQRLGSAAHTCGSAPMGPPEDALAVADGAGRVRGIAGLRIADTSLLRVVPSRAPAAAAIAVGATIADQM